MKENDEHITYENFIKFTITNGFLDKKLSYTSLFIFDCQSENRKDILSKVLEESSWVGQSAEIENASASYDYVFVQEQNFTPEKLFTFIQQHSTKTLIFYDDAILQSQALVNIIEGAVCNNPVSGEKRMVKLDHMNEFMFEGNIIFLTDMTMYKFKRLKKYFYICRDVMKV